MGASLSAGWGMRSRGLRGGLAFCRTEGPEALFRHGQLESMGDAPPKVPKGGRSIQLGKTSHHVAGPSACLLAPPPPDIKNKGDKARPWVTHVLGALVSFQSDLSSQAFVSMCSEHRHVEEALAVSAIHVGHVQDGLLAACVPRGDCLLRVGAHAL